MPVSFTSSRVLAALVALAVSSTVQAATNPCGDGTSFQYVASVGCTCYDAAANACQPVRLGCKAALINAAGIPTCTAECADDETTSTSLVTLPALGGTQDPQSSPESDEPQSTPDLTSLKSAASALTSDAAQDGTDASGGVAQDGAAVAGEAQQGAQGVKDDAAGKAADAVVLMGDAKEAATQDAEDGVGAAKTETANLLPAGDAASDEANPTISPSDAATKELGDVVEACIDCAENLANAAVPDEQVEVVNEGPYAHGYAEAGYGAKPEDSDQGDNGDDLDLGDDGPQGLLRNNKDLDVSSVETSPVDDEILDAVTPPNQNADDGQKKNNSPSISEPPNGPDTVSNLLDLHEAGNDCDEPPAARKRMVKKRLSLV